MYAFGSGSESSNISNEGAYAFAANPVNDPAYADTWASFVSVAGKDDLRIDASQGADALVSSLKVHIAANGPDDLFIMDHGSRTGFGSSYGFDNSQHYSIDYAELFSNIPDGVNVYVNNCFSGGALNSANELPAGAMVFSAVSDQSFGYNTDDVNAAIRNQGSDAASDLTPQQMFLQTLATVDYVQFASNNDYWSAQDASYANYNATSSAADIVPTKFAISGHGDDGVVDLRDHMADLKGQDLSASVANLQDVLPYTEDKDKVSAVAQKLSDGAEILPDELGVASAITYQALDDSGQIGRWKQSAIDKAQQADLLIGGAGQDDVGGLVGGDDLSAADTSIGSHNAALPDQEPPEKQMPDIGGLQAAVSQGQFIGAGRGTSPDVAMQAQAALKSLGYDLGDFGDNGGGIDGKIGSVTTAAIRQFQQDNGLQADGVMGPDTVSTLSVQLAAQQQQSPAQDASQPPLDPKQAQPQTAVAATADPMAAALAQAGGMDGIAGFRDMAAHTNPDTVAMNDQEAAEGKSAVTTAAIPERSAGVAMGA